MLGFCGIYSNNISTISADSIAESINVAKTACTHTVTAENFLTAVSWLGNSVLKGERHFENSDFILQFAGDLVGVESIPWDMLLSIAETKNFSEIASLRGSFAVGIYDKRKKTIHIISDHRAQLPLFFSINENRFTFSTNMATFTVVLNEPAFDIEWLYESLYFNYPIGQTTFLQGVQSVPAASVVTFDTVTQHISIQLYAEPFAHSGKRLQGREALDRCIDVFNTVIPKYYDKNTPTIVPITYGLDCRMLLSYAPKDMPLTTYTYGIPGAADLSAIEFFHKNGIMLDHEAVYFDNEFEKVLPELIYDTVRLSGGLQNVNRTSILYSYRKMLDRDNAAQVAFSGILGDTQFRGHANAPAVTSVGLENYFQTGNISIDKGFYSNIFGEKFPHFDDHIRKTFADFTERYGQPMAPSTHLGYIAYLLAPRYFGGELAIVSNYATFRVPFWDADIAQLAYETEYSTLTFSQFLPKKSGILRENYMQANVICQNPDFRRVPVRGLPLSVFARGNKALYEVSRVAYRTIPWLKKKLGGKKPGLLEDWGKWYGETLTSEVQKLLGNDSLLSNYVSEEFISTTVDSAQSHWLGKLVSTEIILHLIKNRWNIKT